MGILANFAAISVLLIVLTSFVAAEGLVISDASAPDLVPGEQGRIKFVIKNTFSTDVEDVSLSLNMQGLPFSIIGSSESTIEEIEEDEDEETAFLIRASPTAKPGDYQIPYMLTFKNSTRAKTGTVGVRIKGTVNLSLILNAESPVIGRQGKLSFKIINTGFADARYVSLKITTEEMTILSEDIVYIGDVSANDFESASYDVVYEKNNPIVRATLDYLDFSNTKQTHTILESPRIYTRDEAIEKGIIKKNNAFLYIGIIIALIVLWLLWRTLRRRQRMKRSLQLKQGA
jgi:hypothetical protein